MAFRSLGCVLWKIKPINTQIGSTASIYNFKKIGKREVVGHGHNGSACYRDNLSFPIPAVRFKALDNEGECLRAKEKLSWNKLSLPEKKALYRYSFCQTFSEMKAPTGEWKLCISAGLFAVSIALWITLFNYKYLYDEFPITFDEEHRKAQLKRILAMENMPISGLASKWDYENNKWK